MSSSLIILAYDFVICAKDSSVVAAIELDDASHNTPARAETDDKKNRATAAAGIPLLRWKAKSLPDEAAIQAAFQKIETGALRQAAC